MPEEHADRAVRAPFLNRTWEAPTRACSSFLKKNCLSPNPGLAIEFPDARHFILEFQHADRAHHCADRGSGIIGPEDAAILVLVVVETHLVTVGLPEGFAISQLRTPRKQRVTEVELVDQNFLWWRDLCGNFARRFENRSVMPPGARDNVTPVFLRAER